MKNINIIRYGKNPIVSGGLHSWRRAGSFNPAVIYDGGRFYMLERAIQSIRPFICNFGLLVSDNGFDFRLAQDSPVFTANELGYPQGTVEDPRLIKSGNRFLLTYAYRPYTYNCYPTGIGLPEYTPLVGELDKGINHTLSAIAQSKDLKSFETICTVNGNALVDERDNVLFPEKIGGNYALIRRPKSSDKKYSNPRICVSYSSDLKNWSEPELIASPKEKWEELKIGAGAPPIKTEKGWLLIYHGVDSNNIYRTGVMLLDLHSPETIIARGKDFIMEPQAYYEKFGLVIPDVIFPSAAVLLGGLLYIYYGCCDTCISVATVKIEEIINYLT